MTHQYKVGDKVRIKEREGAANNYPCFFADEMAHQKGKIFTIKEIKKLPLGFHDENCKFYNGDNCCYLFKEFTYNWHSSMFEPVLEDPDTSLKIGDLIPICGMIGRIIYTGFGYYLYFDNITDKQEHCACCKKLEELVPNFRKIAAEHGVIRHKCGYFPEFSTIIDLIKFVQAVNNTYNSKKLITTTKTLNENEIRFQKPKTSCIRGSVPTGRAICGRRRKTAIELGHLSNTTCYC